MSKIIILAITFAALAGVGILGNMIFLQVQPLGMFASLDDLPGSICSCADGNGQFSPENCEQFQGEPYSDSPTMICETIAPDGLDSYGNLPLSTQGCSVDFWESHTDTEKYPTLWPSGYSPDYSFNEMFQVSLQLPNEVETDEVTDKTSEPEQGLNLIVALEMEGSQLNELISESAAAMLNAAHPEIDYTYSVPEILQMTQISLAHEDYEKAIFLFKEANDRGKSPICLI